MMAPCSFMAFSMGVKGPEVHIPAGGMIGFGFGGPNDWPSPLGLGGAAGIQIFGHCIVELLPGVPRPVALRLGV